MVRINDILNQDIHIGVLVSAFILDLLMLLYNIKRENSALEIHLVLLLIVLGKQKFNVELLQIVFEELLCYICSNLFFRNAHFLACL